jgi:hypothetical protein
MRIVLRLGSAILLAYRAKWFGPIIRSIVSVIGSAVVGSAFIVPAVIGPAFIGSAFGTVVLGILSGSEVHF